MKRILIMLLVIFMSFSVIACSGNDPDRNVSGEQNDNLKEEKEEVSGEQNISSEETVEKTERPKKILIEHYMATMQTEAGELVSVIALSTFDNYATQLVLGNDGIDPYTFNAGYSVNDNMITVNGIGEHTFERSDNTLIYKGSSRYSLEFIGSSLFNTAGMTEVVEEGTVFHLADEFVEEYRVSYETAAYANDDTAVEIDIESMTIKYTNTVHDIHIECPISFRMQWGNCYIEVRSGEYTLTVQRLSEEDLDVELYSCKLDESGNPNIFKLNDLLELVE